MPPMSTIVVRAALFSDCPELAHLSAQLGYPCTVGEMQLRVERVIRANDHRLLVACDATGVVGWIHAFERFTIESGMSVEVAGLVVGESSRGSGAGTALLSAIASWARERRVLVLWLGCNVKRAATHRFYQHKGWNVIKTQFVFARQIDASAPARSG